MRLQIALTAAVAGVLALGAAAPQTATAQDAKPKRQCFFTNQVSSFAAASDRVVNVRVGVKDVYQFDLLGSCPDVDWSNRIALVSRGSSSICSGLDAEIVTQGPTGAQRCPVSNIRKLTPAEADALPKGAKP